MIRRCIALAAALYPRSWRDQFAREFEALLDDLNPGGRVLMNVVGGAIRMQITRGGNSLKLVVAMTLIGAIVAAVASFTVAPSYVSSAIVSIAPQQDPLRPASPQALRQRATEHLVSMQRGLLSRQSLSVLINDPSLNLYLAERTRMPIDDVEDIMRRNIRIQALPSRDDGLSPIVFSISFAYPDAVKAKATARALALWLNRENELENRDKTLTYNLLWQDLAALHLAKPAPPPPVGDVVSIVDAAGLAKQSAGPNRIEFVAKGLASGLLLGLVIAFTIRQPRRALQLGGFALAGCMVAALVSLLIPETFTSTAVMEIVPVRLTEDPLVAIPPSHSAAEVLQELEPRVLRDDRLANICGGFRHGELLLPLIPKAARDIRRNIRIAVVKTPPGINAASSAFSISFTYPDQRGAVDGVNCLISAFIQESTSQLREAPKSAIQANIVSRRGTEWLDVLDPPVTPQTPNVPRGLIALSGIPAGLLIGAVVLRLQAFRGSISAPAFGTP